MFGLLSWSFLFNACASQQRGRLRDKRGSPGTRCRRHIDRGTDLRKQTLSYAPDHGSARALLTETALLRRPSRRGDHLRQSGGRAEPEDPIAHILRAKCLFLSR